MSGQTQILNLLMSRFYSEFLPGGPTEILEFVERWVHLKDAIPHVENGYLAAVPSNFFHPKVVCCFDFTYKFVGDGFVSPTGIESQRPVSEATLLRVSAQLQRFFKYYYDYILGYYNKRDPQKELRKNINDVQINTEEDANLFVNYVINFYLSSISVDQNLNDIGTCSLTLTDNTGYRFGKTLRLFFDETFSILRQLFAPMVRMSIWSSGRLYTNWMFPLFEGHIVSVEPSNAAGFGSLSITAKDVLEIARISTEMVSPSVLQWKELQKQNYINIYSQPFFGVDHMEIFKMMFLGGKLTWDPKKQRLGPEDPGFQKTKNTNFSALGNFDYASDDGGKKWPWEITENNAVPYKQFNLKRALQDLKSSRARYAVAWGFGMTPFRSTSTASGQTYTAEFAGRLEVLQNIAELVYFNFYVDGRGNVHYHPMRMANQYIGCDIFTKKKYKGAGYSEAIHPDPFWQSQLILEEESTNFAKRVNVEELVTFLKVSGQPAWITGNQPQPELMGLVGAAADFDLMARFGLRRRTPQCPLLNWAVKLPGVNGKPYYLTDMIAKALLQYANAELYTASATLIFRPELSLGRPMLSVRDNSVFFLQSISHSIDINGQASTTIGASFGRKFWQTPRDLTSFMIISQKIYESNKTLPLLPANATPEDVQKYYEDNFGLTQVPVAEWTADLDKRDQLFQKLEEQMSKEKQSETTTSEDQEW